MPSSQVRCWRRQPCPHPNLAVDIDLFLWKYFGKIYGIVERYGTGRHRFLLQKRKAMMLVITRRQSARRAKRGSRWQSDQCRPIDNEIEADQQVDAETD
jgi:hypothetical protein